MDAREIASEILRKAGFLTPEALQAKRNLDARLAGLGLPESVLPPVKIQPGITLKLPTLNERVESILRSNVGQLDSARGAASAVLLDQGGAAPRQVIPASEIPLEQGQATMEPTDVYSATAVTSLATTANGGTEVKFNRPGIVYVGAGAVGAYWNRAVGAAINTKWAPVMSGMRIAYQPATGLFIGTNTVGGVVATGVLTLMFFEMPEHYHKRKGAWKTWHKQIGEWTEGAGDNTGTAGVLAQHLTTGSIGGADVSLGTFSDAGAGTQIFKAATNMPTGGASVKGSTILNALAANTDAIWVAETSALAVASNGGIFAAGQDTWSIPVNGKLFMLASTGTQKLGARYRS